MNDEEYLKNLHRWYNDNIAAINSLKSLSPEKKKEMIDRATKWYEERVNMIENRKK